MNDTKPCIDNVVMPALLRHARTTYGVAMRKALAEAKISDIPREMDFMDARPGAGRGRC